MNFVEDEDIDIWEEDDDEEEPDPHPELATNATDQQNDEVLSPVRERTHRTERRWFCRGRVLGWEELQPRRSCRWLSMRDLWPGLLCVGGSNENGT